MYRHTWKRASFQHKWGIDEEASNAVTLLVPAHILPKMMARAQELEWKFTSYIRYLLANCRGDFADEKLLPAVTYTTQYQSPDMDLVRIPSRVYAGLWLSFSQICRFHGVSRCLMF